MLRPLLTVFLAPGATPPDPATLAAADDGAPVEVLSLAGRTGAHLDAALPAATAPVGLWLGPGEALDPAAALAAASAAARQPHRLWWWADRDHRPEITGRASMRVDLASLLLAHDAPLPTALFRPAFAAERGGFGRHAGPAWAYAHACGQLGREVVPGRVAGPLLTTPARPLNPSLLADRAVLAGHFADRCHPRQRDVIWSACEATRAGLRHRLLPPAACRQAA